MTKTEYLKKVGIYLNMLDRAMEELVKVWNEDIDSDVELNDYLSELFPFDKSLDDLQVDVKAWVRNFNLKSIEQ
jgi:hypothetical protein